MAEKRHVEAVVQKYSQKWQKTDIIKQMCKNIHVLSIIHRGRSTPLKKKYHPGWWRTNHFKINVQCITVYCSVLQCITVYYSILYNPRTKSYDEAIESVPYLFLSLSDIQGVFLLVPPQKVRSMDLVPPNRKKSTDPAQGRRITKFLTVISVHLFILTEWQSVVEHCSFLWNLTHTHTYPHTHTESILWT